MTYRYTEGLCHLREGSLFFPIECTLLLLRENVVLWENYGVSLGTVAISS